VATKIAGVRSAWAATYRWLRRNLDAAAKQLAGRQQRRRRLATAPTGDEAVAAMAARSGARAAGAWRRRMASLAWLMARWRGGNGGGAVYQKTAAAPCITYLARCAGNGGGGLQSDGSWRGGWHGGGCWRGNLGSSVSACGGGGGRSGGDGIL